MEKKKIEIIEGVINEIGYMETFIKIDGEPIDTIFEDFVGNHVKITIETND